MSGVIFSSELRSDNNTRYKVELFGDDYVGFPKVEIIGGTGTTFYVDKDWRDFLQVGQKLIVYIDDTIDFPLATITSIYSNGITTQITTNKTYSASFTHIGSSDVPTDQYKPTFSPRLVDLKTEWKGEGDEILGSIRSSSTSVTFSNDDRYFDRFFEQYQITQDNKLKLLVYRYTTDWELDWAGIIVMDLVQWSNIDKPRPYTFKAIDGLDALKKYEYTQTTLSINTITYNVFNILDILGLKQFWSSSDAYIRESIEYTTRDEKLRVLLTDADSALDYTWIPDNMFIEDAGERPTKYKSYYDVLKGLMDLFSCRIYHADGVYWIQQVRNFSNSVITYREFIKDKTYTDDTYSHQKTVGNSGSENLNILAGGTFGYFAGAYKTRLEIEKHIEGKFVHPDVLEIKANSAQTYTQTFDIGKVQGDGLKNIRIQIPVILSSGYGSSQGRALTIDGVSSATPPQNYSVQVKLEITGTDNKYISGVGPIPQATAEWKNNLVIFNSTDRAWTKVVRNAEGTTMLLFDTPEMNFTDDLTIKITYSYVGPRVQYTTSVGGADTSAFEIKNTQIFFPVEITDDNYDKFEEVTNPSGFFTKQVDLDKMLFIDSAVGTTTIQKIQINDEYKNGTTNLVESVTWDADFSDDDGPVYMYLSKTRVSEAMSLQYKPVEKLMSTIVGDYYPFQSLAYNDKIYVFSGCTRDYEMDEVSGEWFEVIGARKNMTPKDIIDYDSVDDIGPVGGEVVNVRNKIYRGIDELTPVLNSSDTYAVFQKNRVVGDGGVFEGIDYVEEFFPDKHIVQQLKIPEYNGDRVYEGDIIGIVDPNNSDQIDYFEVTADVPLGAEAISVVQKEITYAIKEGTFAKYNKGEVTESNKVRADLFQMKGNALPPTSESGGGGDYFKNGEFMFHERHIYWRDQNGDYHTIQGNTFHP